MRKQKGFSLIELLIVVAIILIIAAIAIPNLLRAKISANESSAVGSVRNIITQEIAYDSTYPTQGYAINLINLGPPAGQQTCPVTGPTVNSACLIDAVLSGASTGSADKSGYGFAAVGGAPAPITNVLMSFTATAVPDSFNSSGTRNFCAFEDGVMRALPPNPANNGGAPVAAGLAAGSDGAVVCTVAPWYVVQ